MRPFQPQKYSNGDAVSNDASECCIGHFDCRGAYKHADNFCSVLFVGTVVSFDAPARQSFYAKLVPPKDLSNAIALNSTAMNGSRFIGPAIGGVMISFLGRAFVSL